MPIPKPKPVQPIQAERKPTNDVIRQRELQDYVEYFRGVDTRAIALRRRLTAGANVEPGLLDARQQPYSDIEGYARETHDLFDNCGLAVGPRDMLTRLPGEAAASPASTAPPTKLPDWLTETPEDCAHAIVMYDSGGDQIQGIEMDRQEYIALKERLGELRGFAVEQGKPAPTAAAVVNRDQDLIDAAILALERDRGNITPGEDFLSTLLHIYKAKDRLTPDRVRPELETFEHNFRDMLDAARDVRTRYADCSL